ncbi:MULTISPECIES: class I SAM-dependent methyltransferase [Microvirga]|uniref:Methyltransferase domain-containing protein n=2 Tax=Microvirga TaxID=186650 RepID=A0ABW9Z1U6_9HYPH|nr:class I SAM-dependent methyltransferase [Microvirga arsenatis]NBJ12778.1 methyltransferase domain-containing protein [Microvirga arsenatis]NBJ26637.1 methyltransferase domain-containing protein [Microvirga arsenatis]
MKSTPRPFVPALGLHSLTGFYDGLIARFLAEDAWKARLVATIAPKLDDVIVDLGCGTGTLGLLLKAACPQTTVIGIDPDPAMLGRARAKAAEGNLDIRFEQAFADALQLDSGSATAVVSSLVLHHLEQPTKRAAFAEAFRVLRPGGRIVIADWANPDNLLMRLAYVPVQVFDGFPNTRDNLHGLLPMLMRHAGFEDVREVYRRRTIFGNLAFLQGTKPVGRDAP